MFRRFLTGKPRHFDLLRAPAQWALTLGLALLLADPSGLLAETAKVTRGRLPDGRAYRIDPASGMRLSDYIAELEVTADDLRRQMVALEDEVSERRRQVEQYERQTGIKIAPKIKETTLLDKTSQLPPAKSAPISCSPQDPLVAGLHARIKELESKTTGGAASSTPGARCDWSSPENPLAAQVAELRRTLAETPPKDGIDQSRKQVATLEEQLAAVNKQLAEKEQRIAQLEDRLAGTDERSGPRARQSSVGSTSDVSASSASNDERVELANALARIQTLVIQRKDLLDAVSKKGRGVTVPIQRLVTRGRVTLDDLRTNVQRFQTGQDSSGIRVSIAEIEQILKDDIAVLKRLSK